MAKTIRITKRFSCVSFQVLALPEARGIPQPDAVVLDQTIVWKGIQWHVVQRNPDRFTFQGKTSSYYSDYPNPVTASGNNFNNHFYVV